MACVDVLVRPRGGFSFENCQRNAYLNKQGIQPPKTLKTGTTIVGVLYNEGVILAADTRATVGATIAEKNCEKIHYVAKNMYCCGAGTSADTTQVTKMISSQLELHRLSTGRIVPVRTAERLFKQYLFRYQGHIGAALILGGVDLDGPTLCQISPDGNPKYNSYQTMGSGSLAAMSVLESQWRPKMELEEAKRLVCDAIRGGIFYDLGSGSNVDICVITKGKTDFIRPYEIANLKGVRSGDYKFKRGKTAVLTSVTIPVVVEEVSIKHIDSDDMDTTS